MLPVFNLPFMCMNYCANIIHALFLINLSIYILIAQFINLLFKIRE